MSNKLNLTIVLSLIAIAVGLRLMPHPANFAPVAAVAIFGGAILPRRFAVGVPLAVMIISDLLIGFYDTILITWACYAVIALASNYTMQKASFRRGFGLIVASSLFFFFVTNLAVFIWSGMYQHSWSGLGQCYTMALPFFRSTCLSDLIYTGALFGTYRLILHASPRLHKAYLNHANL